MRIRVKSLSFQIVFIVAAILLIPVLVMVYDMFFASKSDEILLVDKEQRLVTIVEFLASTMRRDLKENNIELGPLSPEEKTKILGEIFNRNSEQLVNNYKGVRLGLYVVESRDMRVNGFLHNYRLLSPGEAEEREREIMHFASTGINAVVVSGTPLTRLTGNFEDQFFEHLVPLVIDGKLVGVVWAEERLHPIFAQSRTFRIIIKYVALFGLFLGASGALLVIHNLSSGVRRIKKGLLDLEKDISNRMPDMPGEMGQVVRAINNMAVSLEEKERLEQELHRSQRLASLGRLVTGLAHELRNPIGIIKATIQLMENELDMSKDLKKYAEIIKEQVDRQNKVLRELLEFGRPQKSTTQPVSINLLINTVLVFTGPLLKQHNILLTKNMDESLPVIEADGERLKQVFVNLILNAVQAMPEGGKLDIKTVKDGENIKIAFSDTGIGIDEAELQNIFEPFYTTKGFGAGLGLSISHQIVKMHGGYIDVTSFKNKGSTFAVALPILRAAGGVNDDSQDIDN